MTTISNASMLALRGRPSRPSIRIEEALEAARTTGKLEAYEAILLEAELRICASATGYERDAWAQVSAFARAKLELPHA